MIERTLTKEEYLAICSGKIPVCDKIERMYNGFYKAEKDGKYGVLNSEFEVVLPIQHDYLEMLENNVILISRHAQVFELFSTGGMPITSHLFKYKETAKSYLDEISKIKADD